MSQFTRFMKKNKIQKENTTYAATKSLVDENGKPLLWTIKPLSTKDNEAIRDECMVEVPIKGKPNMYRPKLNTSKYLAKMLELWEKGMAILDAALPKMQGAKRENGERLALLGKFIRNSTITTSNVKKWWLVNTKMVSLSTKEEMLKCMDELQKIADAERANTIDTIPVVEQDSRIGWEPSMEYVCDAWHLNWKLRQLDAMQREMDTYRKMIML